MAPDVTPTDPVAGQTQRAARRAGRSHTPTESHALDALSEATGRYARAQARDRPLRRRPSFVVAGVAATVVGVALTLAGRYEYRCAATMRLTGDVSAAQ